MARPIEFREQSEASQPEEQEARAAQATRVRAWSASRRATLVRKPGLLLQRSSLLSQNVIQRAKK